jgi:hypothetical protein
MRYLYVTVSDAVMFNGSKHVDPAILVGLHDDGNL